MTSFNIKDKEDALVKKKFKPSHRGTGPPWLLEPKKWFKIAMQNSFPSKSSIWKTNDTPKIT